MGHWDQFADSVQGDARARDTAAGALRLRLENRLKELTPGFAEEGGQIAALLLSRGVAPGVLGRTGGVLNRKIMGWGFKLDETREYPEQTVQLRPDGTWLVPDGPLALHSTVTYERLYAMAAKQDGYASTNAPMVTIGFDGELYCYSHSGYLPLREAFERSIAPRLR